MPDPSTSTRIGFLIDGDPTTDLMPAVYEFDDLGVRVKVPYLAHDDTRGRWWSHGALFADDPERKKHSYNPPSELDYFDNQGSVGLIGCWGGRASSRFGGSRPATGVGEINARYAVEGAIEASNYLKPHGLRSAIDGLAHWLGFSALRTSIDYPGGEAAVRASTSTERVDDVPLVRSLNLKVIGYATGSGLDSPKVTYRSVVFLETFVKSGRVWDAHLSLHRGIRDLLRVASWKAINFESHRVASLNETVNVAGREKQTWREVRTAATGISPSVWVNSDQFLFTFAEVGRAGVSRWLKLSEVYARGLRPFVRLLDLEGATVDAHVSQLGIAIEAVGYQSLIDAGVAPASANRVPVKERIDHLLSEVEGAYAFDLTFAQDFADSYNSVKHANRTEVPPLTKVGHYRDGVRLLRAWVGLKIGASPATIKGRL